MSGSCRAGGLSVMLAVGIGGCGDDGGGMAWEPMTTTVTATATATGTGVGEDMGETTGATADDDETVGAACEPGTVEQCLCSDGLSLGEQVCDADGVGFGECMCEGEATDAGSTGDPMPPLPVEVCYLGGDRAGTACIPLGAFYAELPLGYEYPPGMSPDGQDRPPLGLIDIEAVDPGLALAPNFALDELAEVAIGRWAVLQPHAIEAVQAMRDAAGSITVVTGYLSPSVNEARGGELYARHQYGDGFDLEPNAVGLTALADLCVGEGGEAVQFESHIHCEWSGVPLDEAFFGPPPSAGPEGRGGSMLADERIQLDAWIEADGHGFWAPALGFVEGEPRRQWSAWGEDGLVLATGEGRWFEAPVGSVALKVRVGGRVTREIALHR